MHPRNRYRLAPPNFRALAAAHPPLQPFLLAGRGEKPALEWTNPRAGVELTRALLAVDFGVRCELPLDRLCPGSNSR